MDERACTDALERITAQIGSLRCELQALHEDELPLELRLELQDEIILADEMLDGAFRATVAATLRGQMFVTAREGFGAVDQAVADELGQADGA